MDKQLPRVSVVICTRDREADLSLCLTSIALLDDVPEQVIVIAGNQSSCSQDLLDRFQSLNISIELCEENNISISRNRGLELANHEIVLFIDDDATARKEWVSAFRNKFLKDSDVWIAGGLVFDSRTDPMEVEFENGVISSSGRQVAVRKLGSPLLHGYLSNVKGCNFGVRKNEIQTVGGFDPFFAFSFDESDLVMTVHKHCGQVCTVNSAIVDHAHSPGHYRQSHELERDWKTEFASHTMFMLKHSEGVFRLIGWSVLISRLVKLSVRCILSSIMNPKQTASRLGRPIQAARGIQNACAIFKNSISAHY
ncbi:MAG: glycosyltransferase [Phycisphaerales bacterium]|nr:glycosyltransferase [Phycisphaerales bacterium]